MRAITVEVPPDALLSDSSGPYLKGRNGFTKLGTITVESGRTNAEIRLELRSPRWTPDPPALAMMPRASARELANALLAVLNDEDVTL